MTDTKINKNRATNKLDEQNPDQTDNTPKKATKEVGGREGPEPTRYGDWEKNGIISDF